MTAGEYSRQDSELYVQSLHGNVRESSVSLGSIKKYLSDMYNGTVPQETVTTVWASGFTPESPWTRDQIYLKKSQMELSQAELSQGEQDEKPTEGSDWFLEQVNHMHGNQHSYWSADAADIKHICFAAKLMYNESLQENLQQRCLWFRVSHKTSDLSRKICPTGEAFRGRSMKQKKEVLAELINNSPDYFFSHVPQEERYNSAERQVPSQNRVDEIRKASWRSLSTNQSMELRGGPWRQEEKEVSSRQAMQGEKSDKGRSRKDDQSNRYSGGSWTSKSNVVSSSSIRGTLELASAGIDMGKRMADGSHSFSAFSNFAHALPRYETTSIQAGGGAQSDDRTGVEDQANTAISSGVDECEKRVSDKQLVYGREIADPSVLGEDSSEVSTADLQPHSADQVSQVDQSLESEPRPWWRDAASIHHAEKFDDELAESILPPLTVKTSQRLDTMKGKLSANGLKIAIWLSERGDKATEGTGQEGQE